METRQISSLPRWRTATRVVSASAGALVDCGIWRSPPSPLRGYGATTFAWLAEPKLGEAERRLVDQNIASWNQIALWLKQLQELRPAA
jgi:hypothetical protein